MLGLGHGLSPGLQSTPDRVVIETITIENPVMQWGDKSDFICYQRFEVVSHGPPLFLSCLDVLS